MSTKSNITDMAWIMIVISICISILAVLGACTLCMYTINVF